MFSVGDIVGPEGIESRSTSRRGRGGRLKRVGELCYRIIVHRQREREALTAGSSSSSSSSRTHQPPASLAVRTQPVMLLKPVKEELWCRCVLGKAPTLRFFSSRLDSNNRTFSSSAYCTTEEAT
ncbi:hypothetical protein Pmani_022817 [Petrolisthes manimaculis]|uniref:Uncharacterized protein n=1 Tax=Petrolisthes manimaculis TaxID=1843537 RepID=A0AAE1PD93_9EUCA|nr:hypothetical protein Pmani_022817 [Petrolisthes manimaculis]